MDKNIYCLYDAAEQIYYDPICFSNDAVAMRYFRNECEKPNTLYQSHPQDFILYNIGSWYQLTGEIIYNKPERVCSASDFVERK